MSRLVLVVVLSACICLAQETSFDDAILVEGGGQKLMTFDGLTRFASTDETVFSAKRGEAASTILITANRVGAARLLMWQGGRLTTYRVYVRPRACVPEYGLLAPPVVPLQVSDPPFVWIPRGLDDATGASSRERAVYHPESGALSMTLAAKSDEKIVLTLGSQKTISLPGMTRFVSTNANVASATLVDAEHLRIDAAQFGEATVLVWSGNALRKLRVSVE